MTHDALCVVGNVNDMNETFSNDGFRVSKIPVARESGPTGKRAECVVVCFNGIKHLSI